MEDRRYTASQVRQLLLESDDETDDSDIDVEVII